MLASHKLARRVIQFWLLVGDGLGLLFSFYVAAVVRFGFDSAPEYFGSLFQHGRFFSVFIVFIFSHYIFDLYEPRHWRSSLFSPHKIVFASITAALLLLAWLYFIATEASGVYGRGILLGAIAGFTAISLILRYLVNRSHQYRTNKQSWLFIGSKESFLSLDKDWPRLQFGDRLHWQDYDELVMDSKMLDVQLGKSWDGLIVDRSENIEVSQRLMRARFAGQSIVSIQNFYEFHYGKVPLQNLDDSWFAFTEGFSIVNGQISTRLKRLVDIFISLVMIVVFSPLILILALIVKLGKGGGPAFYSQIRVGQNGKYFVMWKLRSMRQDAEDGIGAQWAAKGDSRTTRLGRIMRKFRLDELPQLWNILKGEMSFIGPRPERPEFANQLRERIVFYDLRHLVKPGLTGWAQVMYPYGASEEDAYQKLQFELFYIKNYSFGLDIEILLKTISVVLFGAGR